MYCAALSCGIERPIIDGWEVNMLIIAIILGTALVGAVVLAGQDAELQPVPVREKNKRN